MKHGSIRELFDHWNERRGGRVMPQRADIDPAAIRRTLADTFIVSCDASMGHHIVIRQHSQSSAPCLWTQL